MNADDIWMLRRRRRSFDAETGTCSALAVNQRESFHRDDAVETHLPRAIDNAHAAAGDLFGAL